MPLLYPRLPVDSQPVYTQRMISLMSNSSMPAPSSPCDGRVTRGGTRCTESYTEVDNSAEAMDELFTLVSATLQTDQPIILRCNLPTWQSDPSEGFGVDLYDLRAHHAKSLVFLHGFIDKLKAAGYEASYKLTVNAATSCTLIRVTQGDPYAALPQFELDRICSKLKEKLSALVQSDRWYITTLCSIPALIIT